MVFSLSKATALLLAGSMGAAAAGAPAITPTENNRVLRAGTKRSAHLKRSTRIDPTFELDLPYIEEPTRFNGHKIFASNLKVASKKPILNLEDIEHHLEDVQCTNGKVTLRFADTSSAIDARLACHGPEGGILVTSHLGCNKEGERAVYTVHDASATGDGSTLELSVMQSLFEHAFDSIDVGFGHTEEVHSIREHSDLKLRKRLVSEIEKLEGVAATAEGAAADAEAVEGLANGAKNSTSVLGEVSDDAAADPGVHEIKFDMNWEVTNKTFAPDEILAGLPVGFTMQNIANLPIELTCKKCLTRGEIILSQGNIQIDTSLLKSIPDKIKALPGIVASAIPSLINEIPGKMDEAGEKIQSAAAAVPSKVESIVGAVPSKVESLVAPAASVIDAVPSKVESIVAPAASVIDAAPSKIESIVNSIPSILPDLPDIHLPHFGRRSNKAKRDFDLAKVVTGGFVELKANNLEAYLEMGAKPKSTGSFTFMVFDLPVLGFSIPGVGHAGAVLEAYLEADYEFDGGFEMSYGMDLSVPSNSTMRIDLGDMSKSGITGFQDATLTPLPFNFKQKDLDGFVSIALTPSIPIGFKFLSVLNVGVEAEMDLPRLDAIIETIGDADTQCNDLSEDTEGDEEEETEGDETEETDGDETEETDGDETEETDGDETEETDGDETEETDGDETEETDDTDNTEETDDTDDTEETDDTDDTEETDDTDDTEESDDTDETETSEKRKKRSVEIKAIRRASKARRAPASQHAQRRRNLKRQSEAPFPLTNGTNSTQPDKLSLVYVEWNVSMAVELGFNFVLPGMPLAIPGVDTEALNPFKPISKSAHVFTTVKALPTLCLAPAKGFRPATDVYTDPAESDVGTIGTGVGTIGTGVGTIGTGVGTVGTPKFTDVPSVNSTSDKLKKRQYGYGVAIPPYTPATPTPSSSSSSSTSTPCESTATPPPPPVETTPVESTPVESTPVESTPVESTPVESTPVESTPVESTPIESTPVESTPVESTPIESTPVETTPAESTPCETTPVATTPVESSSSDIPPPPESTPVESSSAPAPPTNTTSTPCTTETPTPAPPSSSPCTTGTTITVTLPYNTTTPSYEPTGTATPPTPSKPSEFTGAAAMVMPTVGAAFFAFLAMLML